MKLKKIIRYSTQNIERKDINSVIDALKSDFITEGPIIKNLKYLYANIQNQKMQQ